MLSCGGDSMQPEAIRDAIIARAAQIAQQGIDEQEFLRLKRSAMGHRIRRLDSFDSTCFRLCAYHFSDFDYFRFPEIFRDIESGDIQEFLRRIATRERSSLSVIYPISKEETT
jgi:predicted Zn-dependent peptidase